MIQASRPASHGADAPKLELRFNVLSFLTAVNCRNRYSSYGYTSVASFSLDDICHPLESRFTLSGDISTASDAAS